MEKRGISLFDKIDIKKLIIEFLPFLIILIGFALIAFSLGPYQSYDTNLEFEAASNVVKTGVPYVKAYGTAIDEPPLGFYVEALFLRVFGLSTGTGVALVTFFGFGSAVLMYLVGKELYGKSAGLFAAALFGLNPWQLALSRSFLIDTQCLFFSLLLPAYRRLGYQKRLSQNRPSLRNGFCRRYPHKVLRSFHSHSSAFVLSLFSTQKTKTYP
jgi:4-amino-4-deoxy-L-arabinose transferase-like glycosyltransferase